MRKQHDLTGLMSLPEAFQRAVAQGPDRIALEHGDTTLSYHQLNAAANRLARRLEREDVRPGRRVGIHLARSIDLYVVMLALLKAGATLVPLNPAHPIAVRQAISTEAALPLVLRDDPVELPGEIETLDATKLIAESAEQDDGDLDLVVDPESTALILFTSGSTGRPKGVRIAHRGLSRLADHAEPIVVEPEDTFLQLAPFSFAASTIDIWLSLLHGSRLVVAPPQLPSLPELADTIAERKVNFLCLACGLFNLLVTNHPDALRDVRNIMISGEFPSPQHLAKALETTDARIFNAFGCTENSTVSAVHIVTKDDIARAEEGHAIPIGRPLPGSTMDALDGDLRPVPTGEVGELCIGGVGVAQGYLNAPALTAQKFVDDPRVSNADGSRPLLLRTGDLARKNEDGELVLAGRSDQMVKIRGFRVETREVELVLKQTTPADQVVVKAFDAADNLKELVAFYTTENGEPIGVNTLLGGLRERLPDYMHPARFHHLDELPVNLNGKLDRMALEEPRNGHQPSAGGTAVNDPLTSVIVSLYRSIGDVPKLGPKDSFMAAGGNSLLFIQLAASLQQVLGVTVQAEDIFQHDNAESLARHIEELRTSEGV